MPAPGGGGGFIARALQWVANELIVDSLANNPSFQRFAVRTAKALEEATAKGEKLRGEVVNQVSEMAATLRSEVEQGMRDASQKSSGRRM